MKALFILLMILSIISAGFFYIKGSSFVPFASFSPPVLFSQGLTAIESAPDGKIVIAQNQFIYVLSSEGEILSEFGGPGEKNNNFGPITDIVVDGDQNIWVMDSAAEEQESEEDSFFNFPVQKKRFRKYSDDGTYQTSLNLPKSEGESYGYWSQVFLSTPDDDSVTISDSWNQTIHVYDLYGNLQTTTDLSEMTETGFTYPGKIILSEGNRYAVSDLGNNKIKLFDSNWYYQSEFSTKPSSYGGNRVPMDLHQDGNGNYVVLLASEERSRMRVGLFDSEGKFMDFLVGKTEPLTDCAGIALHENGKILVAKQSKPSIEIYNHSGVMEGLFGSEKLLAIQKSLAGPDPGETKSSPALSLRIPYLILSFLSVLLFAYFFTRMLSAGEAKGAVPQPSIPRPATPPPAPPPPPTPPTQGKSSGESPPVESPLKQGEKALKGEEASPPPAAPSGDRPLTVKCTCGKSYTISPEQTGRKAICKHCGAEMEIGLYAEGERAGEEGAPDAIKITCKCGKTYAIKREMAGRTARCHNCGSELKIPEIGQPRKS